MKLTIKNIFITLAWKFEEFLGFNSNIKVVLCYHGFSENNSKYNVSPEKFEKTITALSRKFKFVNLDTLSTKNKGNYISLTIDDGYKSVLKISEIIKKHKIPVTLFVMSDTNKIDRKELGNTDTLLSISDINKLKNEGWTIGNHSATHSNLIKLDKKTLDKEVKKSQQKLKEGFKTNIDYFAYPKGLFNNKIKDALKKTGYKKALTVRPDYVTSNSNSFEIPRFVMEKEDIFGPMPYAFSKTAQVLRNIKYYYAN